MPSAAKHDYSPLPGDDEGPAPHSFFPEEVLGWRPTHLLFLWTLPILDGQRLPLPAALKSDLLLSRLLVCEASLRGLPLWRALLSLISPEFWTAGAYLLLNNGLVLLSAMLVKFIVQAVGARDQPRTLLLSFAILLASLAQAVSLQQFIHGSYSDSYHPFSYDGRIGVFMCGSKVVSALTARVFHSCLRLRLQKLSRPLSIGEINNVQGKDVNSLRDFVVFSHNLWALPMLIVGTVVLLISLLGWVPGLAGAVLFPLLLPVESYLTDKAKEYRAKAARKSDVRMDLVQEMIDGISTVKLTNLIPAMRSRVTSIRSDELDALWVGSCFEVVNFVISQSSSIVVTVITFTAYVWVNGRSLSAEQAFTSLALISLLGRPVKVLPKCVTMLSEAMVSMGRIQRLLDEAEVSGLSASGSSHLPRSEMVGPHHLCLKNLVAVRPPSVPVVRNTSLEITKPGLYIVTGANASGKT